MKTQKGNVLEVTSLKNRKKIRSPKQIRGAYFQNPYHELWCYVAFSKGAQKYSQDLRQPARPPFSATSPSLKDKIKVNSCPHLKHI